MSTISAYEGDPKSKDKGSRVIIFFEKIFLIFNKVHQN